MNKMQNIHYKIPVTIAFLMLFFIQPAKCQDNKAILYEADSLFQMKRYTQSLELYHQLFEEQHSYTPQMLLKMAYINEGLGNYSQALYYLNEYYLKTSDQDVLTKMEELADKHKLYGYQFTDTDLFLNFYNKYIPEIIMVTLALTLFLFGLMVAQKRKGQRVTFHAAGILLALILLAYMTNTQSRDKMGIISNEPTYVMNGPLREQQW